MPDEIPGSRKDCAFASMLAILTLEPPGPMLILFVPSKVGEAAAPMVAARGIARMHFLTKVHAGAVFVADIGSCEADAADRALVRAVPAVAPAVAEDATRETVR